MVVLSDQWAFLIVRHGKKVCIDHGLCYRVLVYYIKSKINQLLRTLGDVLCRDSCSKMGIFVCKDVYTYPNILFAISGRTTVKTRTQCGQWPLVDILWYRYLAYAAALHIPLFIDKRNNKQ